MKYTKGRNTQGVQHSYSGNALANSSLHAGGKFVGNMMLNFTSRSPFCPGHLDNGIPLFGIQ